MHSIILMYFLVAYSKSTNPITRSEAQLNVMRRIAASAETILKMSSKNGNFFKLEDRASHVARAAPGTPYHCLGPSLFYPVLFVPCRCHAPFSRYSPGNTWPPPDFAPCSRFSRLAIPMLTLWGGRAPTLARADGAPLHRPP